MAETKAEVKKKIAKSMRNIRKIYNSFAIKDMTFKEFAQEFITLGDPNAAARDLEGIKTSQQVQRAPQPIITVN